MTDVKICSTIFCQMILLAVNHVLAFNSGTIGGLASCDHSAGRCSCKPFMEGTKCYECERGYHSVKSSDIFGCEGKL